MNVSYTADCSRIPLSARLHIRQEYLNAWQVGLPRQSLLNRQGDVIRHQPSKHQEPAAAASGRRSERIFGRAIAGAKSRGTAALAMDARLIEQGSAVERIIESKIVADDSLLA